MATRSPLLPLMPDAQLAAYGVGIIALIGGIATVARGALAAPASWAH